MGVLEDQGSALLERYPVQGLSWEQVKELKGPNLVGLGMGSGPAPGEMACLAYTYSLSPSLSLPRSLSLSLSLSLSSSVCGWGHMFTGPCPQAMHAHACILKVNETLKQA